MHSRDESGRTALHYAVAAGLSGMTQHILTRLKSEMNGYSVRFECFEKVAIHLAPTIETGAGNAHQFALSI